MNILEIRTQHVKHRRLNIEAGVQNPPPLMHGDQIPHPREGKGVKCPGYAREGDVEASI